MDAVGTLPVTPAIRYGGQEGQVQDPEHTDLAALRHRVLRLRVSSAFTLPGWVSSSLSAAARPAATVPGPELRGPGRTRRQTRLQHPAGSCLCQRPTSALTNDHKRALKRADFSQS